jgi:hypothetical protein
MFQNQSQGILKKFADEPCAKRGKHPTGSNCLVIGRYSTDVYSISFVELQIPFDVGTCFESSFHARMLMLRKRRSSCARMIRAR